MSYKAEQFLRANKEHRVVYGSVTGPEGAPTGIFYRLEDGSRWQLTRADSLQIGKPRWALEDA